MKPNAGVVRLGEEPLYGSGNPWNEGVISEDSLYSIVLVSGHAVECC
jgi:hypothetical protein